MVNRYGFRSLKSGLSMTGLRRFGWCSSLSLLISALVVSSGCSKSSLIPVAGSVTLEGAAVSFVPAAAPDGDTAPAGQTPANGLTDASGEFTLGSVAGAGAVKGKYKVGVSKAAGGVKPSGGDARMGAPLGTMLARGLGTGKPALPENPVHHEHVNPATAGITAEVKPGMELVRMALTTS